MLGQFSWLFWGVLGLIEMAVCLKRFSATNVSMFYENQEMGKCDLPNLSLKGFWLFGFKI
jgi:hypothetical protein